MTALPLTITHEGLARFTAAQVDEEIDLAISTVGLTDQEFVGAPTLTALPGQFREVATVSGEAVADNIVHMIVRDDAAISYTVRGFGLYLADGTLFAFYGQEDPLFEKSAAATMLLVNDIAFPTGDVSAITFGDTNFLNPPATKTAKGVVELATDAESLAGVDDERGVTPHTLWVALTALLPVGVVAEWYGAANAVPARWAICNGQIVARSDGAGNITTPDFRGRVAVGVNADHALGTTFGAIEKTVNTGDAGAHTPAGELPAHGHDVTGNTAAALSGASISTTTRGDVAGGGSGSALSGATFHDAEHSHGAGELVAADTGPLALEMDDVAAHHHGVTVDVTQPSLAIHFIMRI